MYIQFLLLGDRWHRESFHLRLCIWSYCWTRRGLQYGSVIITGWTLQRYYGFKMWRTKKKLEIYISINVLNLTHFLFVLIPWISILMKLYCFFRLPCHSSCIWADRIREDLLHGRSLHISTRKWSFGWSYSTSDQKDLWRKGEEDRLWILSVSILPGGWCTFVYNVLIFLNVMQAFNVFSGILQTLFHCWCLA